MYFTVSGETRKFVAGGAWHGVTVKVENRSDTAVKGVAVEVMKFAYEEAPDAPLEHQDYVNMQRWDAKSRTWAEIPWDENETEGWLPPVDVAPRGSVTLALRMSVEKDFPPYPYADPDDKVIGSGYITLHSSGTEDEGLCGYVKYWGYSIYKPGTDTGEDGGGEATPTPTSTPTSGTGGSTPTPQTGSSTAPVTPDPTPTGDLAHTGSSSALPVIAGVGAVAVGLGAGAVYVVRRRKSGTEAS
ncbi:LAETG motif-containing sortase-dependent surface protein [Streptomyces sp. NPDC002156]